MNFSIHANEGVVLIDTGYYIFNRYFATLRWFRIVSKGTVDVNIATLDTNEVFTNAFKSHILKDVHNLATYPYITEKRFNPKLPMKNKRRQGVKNKLIFCLDCKRSDIWRMKFYSTYKQSRKHSNEINMNVIGMFHNFLNDLVSSSDNNIVKVFMDKLEADDCVYLILKQLRTNKPTAYPHPVLVITNDNDFLQMIQLNAIVVNMLGVYLSERAIHASAKISTFLKVLTGDLSDNISGVPCVSGDPKQAIALAAKTEKARMQWIFEHGGQSCIKVYKLNKKMILLHMIPRYLAQRFNTNYSFKII